MKTNTQNWLVFWFAIFVSVLVMGIADKGGNVFTGWGVKSLEDAQALVSKYR